MPLCSCSPHLRSHTHTHLGFLSVLCSFTFIVEFFNGIFVTTMLADATLLSGLFLVSIEFLTNVYVCETWLMHVRVVRVS